MLNAFYIPNTPVTVDLNNTLKAIIEQKETSQAIFQRFLEPLNYLNNMVWLDFQHNGYKGGQDEQKDAGVSMLPLIGQDRLYSLTAKIQSQCPWIYKQE